MDETFTKLAREMAEAIASAASADPKVEACRQRARAAGFDMRVSIEAVIGFASRPAALAKVGAGRAATRAPLEISANDRRFLRSLRIAVDEPADEIE